jgi:hypothetical protein
MGGVRERFGSEMIVLKTWRMAVAQERTRKMRSWSLELKVDGDAFIHVCVVTWHRALMSPCSCLCKPAGSPLTHGHVSLTLPPFLIAS